MLINMLQFPQDVHPLLIIRKQLQILVRDRQAERSDALPQQLLPMDDSVLHPDPTNHHQHLLLETET